METIVQTEMTESGVVHVVDDDDDCRRSLARVLSAYGLSAVEHRSAGEYGEYLASTEDNKASCLLLDMYLQDATGLEMLEELARHNRTTPIVFMSGNSDIGTAVKSMHAGALDFLVKPVNTERLVAAVQSALSQDALRRRECRRTEDLRACYDRLTAQEQTVFYDLVHGRLNKQIAGKLGACERTVKTHRSRIMHKMRAQSVAELVRIANDLGLLDSRTPLAADR
jgi:FixJ family two-component response regulator